MSILPRPPIPSAAGRRDESLPRDWLEVDVEVPVLVEAGVLAGADQRRPGEPVVLAPTLQRDRTGAAGTAQRTFDFMMELRGVPRVMLEESSERVARRTEAQTAVVFSDLQPSSIRNRANADAWSLEPLTNDEGGGFTLWRITRR